MLLLEENKKFYSYLLNSEYLQKSTITTKTLPSKYRSILGYSVNNNTYAIFFANSRNTKFGIQTFNFDTKSSTNVFLDFKIKGEKYVESVNYKNKIHLITISKNSSELNIYTFDNKYQPQKKVISLKQVEYQNPSDQYHTINAHYLLTSDSDGFTISVEKIESRNPNVIETTSKLTKLYLLENQLIFSFDYDKKETKLCIIDLDTFLFTYKVFDKPSKTEKGFTGSNSYIYDNKIFQIASSSQKMKFTISDIISNNIIKEYAIKKEDSITFKNSPIIQEGGTSFFSFSNNDRIREMEKTAKYLRKISNSNLGISTYKVNDQYNIILGGTKEIYSGGGNFAPGFGSGFGAIGTVGNLNAISINFNPTFYGYNGYRSNKSTYINCLFDHDFEHLQGDIPKNIYDKVNEFEDTLKKPSAINIFLHNYKIHYGFFDKTDKMYKLYRFED
ncbi:hypothetical protein [Aquimarina sp. I32.4]|uniref:hypothetical protein n=1 Tax=Aquimarina sp. I32.4 TaxID=2053903 RepID=UPI000CDE7650|nr:hypothetical protein [Aquimarina sp. I32.4]